jgi:DNA-binding response OmpR family regulator
MDKIKVLYVEDELSLGKIVKESLASRGFDVAMESDGAKVLSRFKNLQPDVCILDVMLPNKDGFEIAEEIRLVNDKVPILFLTAKTQTEDLVRGFTIGGNDYIRKPFSMEELIVRIQNVVRKINASSSNLNTETLALGRYQLHLNRQLLQYGNEEKRLSYREMQLLKLLIENKNGVTDRKEILNLLWGSDSFFNSRNLDVYITRLRNYIKEDDRLEIITVKGIGYRFIGA